MTVYLQQQKAQLKRKGSQSKTGTEEVKPNKDMLERVRGKQAKRKAEEDEVAQRPNKAACEREERMASVQLKAYWACYPLQPIPPCNGSSGGGANRTGQAKEDAPKKQGSVDRKQLLNTLRSSIDEKRTCRSQEEETS